MASFLEDLTEVRKELICKICGNPARPGKKYWYRCMNLHQICQDCKAKIEIDKCACGQPISFDYCKMTEKLLSVKRLKLNCINTKNGCQEVLADTALDEHEIECIYRVVPCLTFNAGILTRKCNATILFREVIDHYERHVQRNLLEGVLNARGSQKCNDIALSGQDCFKNPIKFTLNNHTFLLAQKTVDKVIYSWVYIYGSVKEAQHFSYTLKLFGSKATTIFEGKVAAIDETFGDLCDAGKCYGVPYKLFESELDKNRGFTFSLMIRIPARTSDAVDSMVVDPVRGKVIATFSTGTYEYNNISDRESTLLSLVGKFSLNITNIC